MDEFVKEIKDSYTVQGITEDYVWYQSKLLANRMNEWQMDFERLVNVMENRHKEHLKIISNLLDEIKKLKEENNELKRSGDHINSGQGNNQAG
jgi:hypothetical protein